MGANCIVRMINDIGASMLGYSSKSELISRNVNVIVPPPFSRCDKLQFALVLYVHLSRIGTFEPRVVLCLSCSFIV
jgi:hypothetical protein